MVRSSFDTLKDDKICHQRRTAKVQTSSCFCCPSSCFPQVCCWYRWWCDRLLLARACRTQLSARKIAGVRARLFEGMVAHATSGCIEGSLWSSRRIPPNSVDDFGFREVYMGSPPHSSIVRFTSMCIVQATTLLLCATPHRFANRKRTYSKYRVSPLKRTGVALRGQIVSTGAMFTFPSRAYAVTSLITEPVRSSLTCST